MSLYFPQRKACIKVVCQIQVTNRIVPHVLLVTQCASELYKQGQ